jgi:hypothetical protein
MSDEMHEGVVSANAEARANSHRLELMRLDLVGGGRTIYFQPGLNIIQGDITTGKTTLVRLLRALLSTFPDAIAPEVGLLAGLRAQLGVGNSVWSVYRPRTTSRDAMVEIATQPAGAAPEASVVRLPVSGHAQTYSRYLLEGLALPAVAVPQARSEPTGATTTVSMGDWLAYCIVPGDELDTQVFGHRHPFRDSKRRWVFELAYGYYEPELFRLSGELRALELRLNALRSETEIREKFLSETPFMDGGVLRSRLEEANGRLAEVRAAGRDLGEDARAEPGVLEAQARLYETRAQIVGLREQVARASTQVQDLRDLQRQLESQSARITRAIVADEWLVDFDFVVCPRCGTDLEPQYASADVCYLCGQHPHSTFSQDQLLSEQDRLASQIGETRALILSRDRSIAEWLHEVAALEVEDSNLSRQLDMLTETFISDAASHISQSAAAVASLEADVRRFEEYLLLLERYEQSVGERTHLEAMAEEVAAAIDRRELLNTDSEENVAELERRMQRYVTALNIPRFDKDLTVAINRRTYLPEISGRTFDELSSQGLKTLVNIAHALAHHTVAIDRGLPMPGLLVLDGISANSGFEGFDQDRVQDVYHLLADVAAEYAGRLQIVAVDNEVSRSIILELTERIVLTLSQDDRLIRIPD